MHKVSINDAAKQLRRLLEEADRGEEVVIIRGDGASFKLISLPKRTPRPTFGSAKGDIWMSEAFDAPLDDFEDDVSS